MASLHAVTRVRALALLLGVTTLAALCVPAVASAGTFTWSMPQDFTVKAPGANPDHDQYGATPWSYAKGTQGELQFSAGFDGGLSGWSDNPASPQTFVAVNSTSSPVNGIAPGQLAMQPAPGGTIALAWTAPINGTVTLSGSVEQANPGSSSCGFTWYLTLGATTLASGSGSGTIPSMSAQFAQSDTMHLVVADASTSYDASCVIAAVSLALHGSSSPPSVTLDSPGTRIAGAQPVFTGTGTENYSDVKSVNVHIYRGDAATGTPVETVPAALRASGGTYVYSVAPNPKLLNGPYTAQAEQDNLAGDAAFSSPVAFVMSNFVPKVTLRSLGRKPSLLSRPTFSGTASTIRGAGSVVLIAIYSGIRVGAKPIRLLTTSRSSLGRFSLRIGQGLGLGDGQYTAVAIEGGIGPAGVSAPQRFVVKRNPPALTLAQPASGAIITGHSPVFSGAAGNVPGDFHTVTILLYRGALASGRPLARARIRARGAVWSTASPKRLGVGVYTLVAKQSDDLGRTRVTIPRSFFVTIPPPVIGLLLNLDRSGYASADVTCPSAVGVCDGSVAAVTTMAYKVSGGPRKLLEVLSAHVTVPAGETQTVRQKLAPALVAALRGHRAVEVQVNALLSNPAAKTVRVSVPRLLVIA